MDRSNRSLSLTLQWGKADGSQTDRLTVAGHYAMEKDDQVKARRKNHRPGHLDNRNLLLTVPEAGSSGSKCP